MLPKELTLLDNLETLDEVRAQYAETIEMLRLTLAEHEKFLAQLDDLRAFLALQAPAPVTQNVETLQS